VVVGFLSEQAQRSQRAVTAAMSLCSEAVVAPEVVISLFEVVPAYRVALSPLVLRLVTATQEIS